MAQREIDVSRHSPPTRQVLAPERHVSTGRRGAADRSNKNEQSARAQRGLRRGVTRRPAIVAAGVLGGAGLIAVIALVAANGGDDDTSSPVIGSDSSTLTTSPVTSASAPTSDAATSDPASTDARPTTDPVVDPEPAEPPGYSALFERTEFRDDPNPLNQEQALPPSQQLEIVCGPTRCLLPTSPGVHALLFDRDADSIDLTDRNEDLRTQENGLRCLFVAEVTVRLQRQPDGSLTGVVTRRSEVLSFSTTFGDCFNFDATWNVTMTPTGSLANG